MRDNAGIVYSNIYSTSFGFRVMKNLKNLNILLVLNMKYVYAISAIVVIIIPIIIIILSNVILIHSFHNCN